ncbi:MAG: response regulator, partial [Campylobacterota bacterium]|nr:response regulator [Campylobacterota bacterium]
DIAQNGVEAVELYTNNKDKYELILMDLQMPIMDGYEATKQIRDKDKNIPIIALTANAMKEDVQKTKSIGMNDHLNKPIDVEKLYEALLKYISKKEDIKISNKNDVNEVITSELNFKHIDTKIGLGHLIGNNKLYIKILEKFFTDYKELNLNNLDEENYKRVLHTIKGISASIGAMQLNIISKELEVSYSNFLVNKFQDELKLIINELDIFFTLNKSNNKENNSIEKPEIEQEKRDILLNNLYESADMMELEQCQKILEKLSLYKLNDNDNKIFEKSKIAIEEYDFDEIIEMLEK